jgi:alkylation response protein AidB-like acyl-CoA dehydrogenase
MGSLRRGLLLESTAWAMCNRMAVELSSRYRELSMDFDYGEKAEAFRREVREWLEKNLPKDRTGDDLRVVLAGDDREKFLREWDEKLREAGYVGIAWPKEYGGRGLSTLELLVFNEEMVRARAPQRLNFFGEGLVGPTIMQWGTEEQKKYFLPKILSGEHIWCQGFSEPNAGSDLASLQTRAVIDGDELVITGQKVWTTMAQYANWCFVLARTDPNAEKRKGISYLLVPMDQPGVEVRPLKQLTGTAEFNEVFFDGARTSIKNVVGGLNNGWTVAMTTLGFERGGTATTSYLRFSRELRRIIELARDRGKLDDPLIRQRLASHYIDVEIMRYLGYRTLTSALAGKPPGPESSITKLFWSEYHRRAMETMMQIRGLEGQVVQEGYELDAFQYAYLFSLSETIYAGTSEIQRNIIGERILGLPKEPRPEKKPAISAAALSGRAGDGGSEAGSRVA